MFYELVFKSWLKSIKDSKFFRIRLWKDSCLSSLISDLILWWVKFSLKLLKVFYINVNMQFYTSSQRLQKQRKKDR